MTYVTAYASHIIEEKELLYITSDLDLPDGDGFKLLEIMRLKKIQVPFLFLSCHEKEEYETRALEKGANLCMNKLSSELVKESLMRGSTMRESVTDVRIILECLQEAYQMEGDMVRSGKNIHATMIYPFVRMLQEKCRDLTEEQIHKTLWKEYEISGADRMFVERASKILEPYEGESEDEK